MILRFDIHHKERERLKKNLTRKAFGFQKPLHAFLLDFLIKMAKITELEIHLLKTF